jgi:predicted phage tail protein
MASDGELKVHSPGESIEALTKEAEALKAKLEEERQKLNDVACKKDNQTLHFGTRVYIAVKSG